MTCSGQVTSHRLINGRFVYFNTIGLSVKGTYVLSIMFDEYLYAHTRVYEHPTHRNKGLVNAQRRKVVP